MFENLLKLFILFELKSILKTLFDIAFGSYFNVVWK